MWWRRSRSSSPTMTSWPGRSRGRKWGPGSTTRGEVLDQPYREDLAHVHDAGFGALARHGAEALLAALARQGLTSGLVIDLGCGSGILSEIVANAGYDVL